MARVALAALGLAAGLVLLACTAEQPGSFEGPRIGKAKDKGDDDDDDKEDKSSTTQASTTDNTPSPSPAPKDAGPPAPTFPDCKSTTTLQACLTCCDTGGVYQTFFTSFNNCGADATCKSTASQQCLANATCKNADLCMAANGCWDKPVPDEP